MAEFGSRILTPGHTDSVLCCEVLQSKKLLASGSEDGTICLTDLCTLRPVGRVQVAAAAGDADAAVPALCCHPGEEHTLFAAAGSTVLQLDLRQGLGGGSDDGGAASAAGVAAVAAPVCRTFEVNQDEINSLAATSANGGWLAAGDDSGEVQVISLQLGTAAGAAAADAASGTAAAARPAAAAATYKTLRRGHSNICSAVAFRPHRPWELLSGGLDATLVKWDFSRLRALHSWNLNGEATASGGQLFNPPMVHSIAVPQAGDRGLGRLVAVGRGDGCISIYDADYKPTAAGSSGGSSGSSSSSKRGAGKARAKTAALQGGAAAAAGGAVAVPGRVALLGPEQGGHTAAVNCVTFFPGGGCGRQQQLLSAGNDCRLLLWNWPAAEAAGHAAAEAAAKRAAGGGESTSSSGGLRPGGTEQQQQPSDTQRAAAAAAMAAAAAAAGGGTSAALPLLATQYRHGRKINWVCCADVPGCVYNVLLADTGRRVTALTLA